MNNITLILISVSLTASAQLFMRKAMLKIGEISISLTGIISAFPRMIGERYLWIACGCYGLSIITWLIVLSKCELSYAYAFSSVGFILTTAAGAFFLKEHISITRVAGILIICIGVILTAKG